MTELAEATIANNGGFITKIQEHYLARKTQKIDPDSELFYFAPEHRGSETMQLASFLGLHILGGDSQGFWAIKTSFSPQKFKQLTDWEMQSPE